MAEICLRQVFLVAGGCTFGESCRFDGTGCSIGSLRQCWSTYSRYWDLKKLWISTGKCRKCHKWFDFYAFKGLRRWIMEVCAQVFWGKFGKKVRTTQKRSHYMNIHVCIHIYIYIFWHILAGEVVSETFLFFIRRPWGFMILFDVRMFFNWVGEPITN